MHVFVSIDETVSGRNNILVCGYPKAGKLLLFRMKATKAPTPALAVIDAYGRSQIAISAGLFSDASFVDAQFVASPFQMLLFLLIDSAEFHHSIPDLEYAADPGVELRVVPAYARWFSPVEGDFSVAIRRIWRSVIYRRVSRIRDTVNRKTVLRLDVLQCVH